MDHEIQLLKNALGRFATGVAVAACKLTDAEGYAALTMNSFTSVALNPPLVLWCIENKAASYAAFMAADSYSVSVLRADQEAISARFASRAPEPLRDEEIDIWQTGAPLLKERLAGFDCRVHTRHKAGDHVLLLGEVVQCDSAPGAPLVYYASRYRMEIRD